jgi:hypothetical protein
MTAPIFNMRNVKVSVPNSSSAFAPVYGVVLNTSSYASLAAGVAATDVSAVVLTVQCANTSSATINVSVIVTNSVAGTSQMLVSSYPVIPNNAFDPLSGNLILGANDVLQVMSVGGTLDVVASLMEIANAASS